MMKLLIAIPAYESLRTEFNKSLFDLENALRRDGIVYDKKIIDGTMVHVARDRLAQHAVNNEFTHVLWLDSDMVFDGHLLEDLTISGEKDMVCGLFISRHYPFLSCVFASLDPVERIEIVEWTDAFRVAACGFGCVLMKTEVLKAVMVNNHGKCFVPEQKMGEDCAFCKRATDLGFEIWCEPSARVGHVASIVIWPEDGPRFRGEIQGLEGKTLN